MSNSASSLRRKVALSVDIPKEAEIEGEPLIICALSNGQLQVNIPQQGGIPRALALVANALSVFASMQHQADAERESRIIKNIDEAMTNLGGKPNGRFH